MSEKTLTYFKQKTFLVFHVVRIFTLWEHAKILPSVLIFLLFTNSTHFQQLKMNSTNYTINPQNPYVFNEYLFIHQTHFNFNGSAYALFLRLVNIIIPSLGILGASTVAYMALFHTPTHIKPFSRMILLCSCSDMFYGFCDIWCMSVSGNFWGFEKWKEGLLDVNKKDFMVLCSWVLFLEILAWKK